VGTTTHSGTARWTPRRAAAVVSALLILPALLAGCASGADDAAMQAMDADEAATDDGAAYEESGGEGAEWAADADTEAPRAAPNDGDAAPTTTAVNLGRRVVRTATLELESADPNRLVQELTATVASAGGFVATSDLRRDEQGVVRGTVTVRVPSEALDATLDDLEELADNAPIRRIDERDVTVESADLEAQLDNLTAYETELRTLLADVRETTTRPEDLLTVFERIRQVRAEIDQIQGRLAVLSDQVSLATIAVTITPTSTAVPVADPTWQPGSTARDALTAATRALSGIADAAIWFTLAVLPVIAVIAVPTGAAWLLWRRRSRGEAAAPPSAGSPSAAPPTAPVA
jgi:SepF-like predicted cell division protein (DUF552 family)